MSPPRSSTISTPSSRVRSSGSEALALGRPHTQRKPPPRGGFFSLEPAPISQLTPPPGEFGFAWPPYAGNEFALYYSACGGTGRRRICEVKTTAGNMASARMQQRYRYSHSAFAPWPTGPRTRPARPPTGCQVAVSVPPVGGECLACRGGRHQVPLQPVQE